MANPFTGGGKVQFVPGKVVTPLEEKVPQSEENAIRNMALQRDLVAADLLEGDKYLDMLDAAIDDQMKDFQLPGGEDAADSARRLCGSETINWDCYKKAKALLEVAPWIAHGYDPVQLVFGGQITKRKGPAVFNCRDFDPEKFFDAEMDSGGSSTGERDQSGADPFDTGLEDPAAIQKRAQNNQKKWSLLVMFWELLWGRPAVSEKFLKQLEEGKENVQELQDKISALQAVGRNEESEKLAKQLGFSTLPDMIRDGRPTSYKQLLWEAYPPTSGPLENVKANPSIAAAIWTDPWEFIKGETGYKNKGIPALKEGFILSILIGGIGLIPKILSNIIKIRNRMTNKLKKFKRVPVVGKALYRAWGVVTGFIYLPIVFINDIFIELCIWLAMKPSGYIIDVGKVPDEYKSEIGDIKSDIDEKTITSMDVEETPAGFVPMDCMVAAQDIVNKVHTYASS